MQSDIKLHIFGDGWEKIADEYSSNTIIHSPISYYDTAKLCRNSKVLFNVMPLFKDGSHDRIATAMLNETAAITDHSKYLDQVCGDYISFFDINQPWELPDKIQKMLDHYEELLPQIRKAKEFAEKNMTWDYVADKIIEIL